ncbi:MAG: hydrolase 2, exosortase A system-associated [Betaproteobacteria bacterium]
MDAFFLPAEPGARFCVYHSAPRAANGILYVHPFAEEMNKSRRMAALQAARLAARGFNVLQVDLLGCGDSSGDFGEASWEAWKNDVRHALCWLRERCTGSLTLWGLRLGATLAADVARDPAPALEQLVLWHPVASGEQFMTQFLRLRLAAEMMGGGQVSVSALRAALAGGEALEIAGYELPPALARAIDALKLAEIVPAVKRACWLEVSATLAVSPASMRVIDAWTKHAISVDARAVQGEAFWSTPEITEAPALPEATEACLLP